MRAGVYSSIPAFIAIVFLAAPGATLPCLASDRAEARAGVDDGAEDRCCSGGVNDTTDSSKPDNDNRSPCDSGACDCPPGCPAPCGAGKLPCPPVEPFTTAADMAPAGVVPCQTSLPASDATPEGVFHPPRV